MIRLFITLLLCPSLLGATYYVATTGSDTTGNGSVGLPWRTITNAAAVVSPGDTVIVAAGTYTNHVALTRSGTAAQPINWIGTWDTTIQPSVAAASGWVPAADKDPLGNGVYKHTTLAFEPSAIIANGKYVLGYFDFSNGGFPDTDKAWLSGTYSPLTSPTDATRADETTSGPFWDGVEAFWHWTNSTAYIRFRDGSDPNGKSIRIVDNSGSRLHKVANIAAFKISANYNRVFGFRIQHGHILVSLQSGATGNVIESNRLSTALCLIQNNGRSNSIVNNHLDQEWYAGGGGAYRLREAATWGNYNQYLFTKGQVSTESVSPPAVSLSLGYNVDGDSNVITGNTFTNVEGGIYSYYGSAGADSVTIASNSFANISAAGILIGNGNGTDDWRIHDNLFQNVFNPIRRQRINTSYRTSTGRHYIYRNRGWNPGTGRGSAVYYSLGIAGGVFKPQDWVYHNSWENYGFGLDGPVTTPFNADSLLANVRFLNNIMTVGDTIRSDSYLPDNGDLGRFAYNRIRFSVSTAATWYSANIVNTAFEWGTGTTPPSTLPDFLIDETSVAWNSATNLTALSLPDSRSMQGNAWDIGWHEYSTSVPLPSVNVSALASSVFETGTATAIRVSRTGSTAAALSGTVTASGSAVRGVNYTVALSWTIGAGDAYVDLTFTPVNDGVRTGDVSAVIALVSSASFNIAGTAATVAIVDSQRDRTIPSNPQLPGGFRPPR
jgi:hypothetical protein